MRRQAGRGIHHARRQALSLYPFVSTLFAVGPTDGSGGGLQVRTHLPPPDSRGLAQTRLLQVENPRFRAGVRRWSAETPPGIAPWEIRRCVAARHGPRRADALFVPGSDPGVLPRPGGLRGVKFPVALFD